MQELLRGYINKRDYKPKRSSKKSWSEVRKDLLNTCQYADKLIGS